MGKTVQGRHQFTSRQLIALILPLTLESALNILIGMADTMMVANCGEAAVSAVSLVDSISFLLMTLFNAFATGGAVICSQYLGHREDERAKDSARNLVYIAAVIGLLTLVVILPTRGLIIKYIFGDITPEVAAYADDYFFFLTLSYPFLALYCAFTALCRSEERTKRTFYVALLMNAINLFGNAILIFVCGLGPMGAAIATLTSRVIGSALLLFSLMKKNEKLSISGLLKGPFDKTLIKRIVRVGVPTGVEGSFFQVGKIMILSLVSSLGTSAVAINAVVGNYNSYAAIVGNAINLASITIIGQCRGNDNFEDIDYYTKLMMILIVISTTIISIPLYIFSPQVISWYGLEPGSIIEAVPIARSCLLACIFLWPFAFSMTHILKAVGDVKYIMVSSMIIMLLVRVLGAYILILGFSLGVWGVWLAMYADWIVRAVFYVRRYRLGKWKEIRLI